MTDKATTRGAAICSTGRMAAASAAHTTPKNVPMTRPSNAFLAVVIAASRMMSRLPVNCSQIADGLGST